MRELVCPGGRTLVEVEPPGKGAGPLRVRAEIGGEATSTWFPWALVAADEVKTVASESGFVATVVWCEADRWFARLDAR